MNKQNKGITLIALVITIVVLVILVGVSVSVTINTGLIANTKKAVANYDEEQKDEEILLTDMEVKMDFITKETPYEFKNEYLTGIQFNNGMTEKVSELELRLPTGYTVHLSDKEDIDDKTKTNVITGMVLRKNGVKVGHVVVFGDTNKSGTIDMGDSAAVMNLVQGHVNFDKDKDQYYDIVAMDVNHDGIIDDQDYNLISDHFEGVAEINQSVEVEKNAKNIVIKNPQWYMDNYINELPETFRKKYNVYFSDQYKVYQIDIKSSTVTAATFLADLQDPDAVLEVYDEASEKWVYGVTDETLITKMAILYAELGTFGEREIIYIFGV